MINYFSFCISEKELHFCFHFALLATKLLKTELETCYSTVLPLAMFQTRNLLSS